MTEQKGVNPSEVFTKDFEKLDRLEAERAHTLQIYDESNLKRVNEAGEKVTPDGYTKSQLDELKKEDLKRIDRELARLKSTINARWQAADDYTRDFIERAMPDIKARFLKDVEQTGQDRDYQPEPDVRDIFVGAGKEEKSNSHYPPMDVQPQIKSEPQTVDRRPGPTEDAP